LHGMQLTLLRHLSSAKRMPVCLAGALYGSAAQTSRSSYSQSVPYVMELSHGGQHRCGPAPTAWSSAAFRHLNEMRCGSSLGSGLDPTSPESRSLTVAPYRASQIAPEPIVDPVVAVVAHGHVDTLSAATKTASRSMADAPDAAILACGSRSSAPRPGRCAN
jgi:hypothetical protein